MCPPALFPPKMMLRRLLLPPIIELGRCEGAGGWTGETATVVVLTPELEATEALMKSVMAPVPALKLMLMLAVRE
jgi:hypothetical protein